MNMRHVLTTLFTRRDTRREELVAAANEQSVTLVSAAKRLQDTIGELMERNDDLTFRGVLKNAKGAGKQ